MNSPLLRDSTALCTAAIMVRMSLAPSPPAWAIRPLTAGDVERLLHIQTVTYGPGLQEDRDVFARRLTCAHHCSVGAVGQHDDRLLAYLVAYWAAFGHVTPLNGDFDAPPEHGRVLYIHDIAVLPDLAGQGVAQRLIGHLLAQARLQHVRQAALVAVQGSMPFWRRQGFAEHTLTNATELGHLRSYGPGAVFMSTAL